MDGRGSKRIARFFEKKIEAENYLRDYKNRSEVVKTNFSGIGNFEETTFRSEANAWIADGRLRFSPSHLKRSEGILTELLPKIGNLTAEKLTPAFLSCLQRKLKEGGSKSLTVNRKTEVITAILNFSVKQRRIPFNPSSGFRKLPSDQAEMQFWERMEAEDFLRFVSEKYPAGSSERWIYLVYALALNTGMRAGEIWGLQPRDLNSQSESIFIRRQFDRVKKDFGITKGKKSRHVPCHAELMAQLLAFVIDKKTRFDQTVFHGAEGRPVNHDSFGDRRFDKDVKRWGGRRIRFHDLRHTAATLMIGNGIDLKTVKEICGHKDISTTMGYAHLLGNNLRQVAKSFSIKPATRLTDQFCEPEALQNRFGKNGRLLVDCFQ